MISSISATSSYMGQMNSMSMSQRLDNLFSKIDSNGSGSLDKTEFSAFAKKLSQDSGNSIDVDSAFSTYDANGDGSLSESELDSFMKANTPPPPPGGTGGPGDSQSMQQHLDDLFSKIDSDGSGSLSKSEFSTFASKLSSDSAKTINVDDVFSSYDTDGDGTLSESELDSYMKDNAPQPPGQMQNAISAYSAGSSDRISSLMDLLNNSKSGDSSSSNDTNSFAEYIAQLMQNISSGIGNTNLNSLIDVKA